MMNIKISYDKVVTLEAFVEMNQLACRKIMHGIYWDCPLDQPAHWTEETIGDALNHRIVVTTEKHAAAMLMAMAAEIMEANDGHLSEDEKSLKEQWLDLIAACFH